MLPKSADNAFILYIIAGKMTGCTKVLLHNLRVYGRDHIRVAFESGDFFFVAKFVLVILMHVNKKILAFGQVIPASLPIHFMQSKSH